MPKTATEKTLKAQKYIEEHADEYILSQKFPHKVAKMHGVSYSTVRKICQKLGLKPAHKSEEEVRKLFSDGQKHHISEVVKVGGYSNESGAWSMVKKLGYVASINHERKKGKYQGLDITKYQGMSQAELARELGVRYDAICRAVKAYGWGPYLKPVAKKKITVQE